jgi:hypothetical protein
LQETIHDNHTPSGTDSISGNETIPAQDGFINSWIALFWLKANYAGGVVECLFSEFPTESSYHQFAAPMVFHSSVVWQH